MFRGVAHHGKNDALDARAKVSGASPAFAPLGPLGPLAQLLAVAHMTILTIMTRSGDQWSVAEAKARFSELLERARTVGPQRVTRSGQPAAVVVSVEEWERKNRRTGSLAEFLAASPLRNSGLIVERAKDPPRKVDL
jgi:prevent-host-death family protein